MVDENLGSAPADTGTASTPSGGGQASVTEDILATLRHNPFPGGEAPKGKGAKAPGGKTGNDAGKTSKGNVGKPADGSSVAAQPAMNIPAPDPEKDALRQSLDTANALIDAYKGGRGGDRQEPSSGQGQQPQTQQRQQQPSAPANPYNFNIPKQLITALTSDKPEDFEMGLKGFATGVAQAVHTQMLAALKPQIEALLATHVPRMVGPQLENYNTRKAIFDDFYGSYKELNNPTLYPMIANITQDVMTALKTNQWSPAVRDTVAKRVKEILGSAIGGVAPVQTQQTQQNPLPKHPTMSGGGSSRGPVQQEDSLSRDIMDTLGF